MASSPPKGSGKPTWILLAVLLLLIGAAVAIWWFFFREGAGVTVPSLQLQFGTSTPLDAGKFAGKLYGNSDLTHMYYMIDSSTVKILKVGEACKNVSWSLDSDSKMTIDGRQFTVQTDAIYDIVSGVTFDEMTGPIDDYCTLIGSEF